MLDYDDMEVWTPTFSKLLGEIADQKFFHTLQETNFEYIEDARDAAVDLLGNARLVRHLNAGLKSETVRFYHGTRGSAKEVESIKKFGLLPLSMDARKEMLISQFSRHPRWREVEGQLDQVMNDIGPGQYAGVREDNYIYALLSRSGLLGGCTHYLGYGSEADGHVASILFDDTDARKYLMTGRPARIVAIEVGYQQALDAMDPYGTPNGQLPTLLDKFFGAWCYWQGKNSFSVVSLHSCEAARFGNRLHPKQISIVETISDHEINYEFA